MPSEKVLQSKQQIVAELTEKLKSAQAGVLVDYKGITVEEDTKLRKELREAGVDYSVMKNTMIKFAAANVGYEELNPVLEGTTSLAISQDDPIAAARIINSFCEKSKGTIKIKAGFLDGKVVDVATVEALAKIPSKEVLIAQLLSCLNGPITGLAIVLDQLSKKEA